MLFGKHRIFFLPTSPRRPQSEQMASAASRASWRFKQLAHRIDSPGKGKNLTPRSTQRSASARLLAFFFNSESSTRRLLVNFSWHCWHLQRSGGTGFLAIATESVS